MAIQVDPISSPRIITIPEADGISITVQSLVNQIREWEHDLENLSYTKLLSTSGKEVLDEETKVGITSKLENTKLKFADRSSPTVCSVTRGNIVAVDANNDPMNVIESSTNVTVIVAQSTSPSIVYSDDVWTELEKNALINTVNTIEQVSCGKWQIVSNQMIFYEDDNLTEIMRFNLFNSLGQPAMRNVFKRVRA